MFEWVNKDVAGLACMVIAVICLSIGFWPRLCNWYRKRMSPQDAQSDFSAVTPDLFRVAVVDWRRAIRGTWESAGQEMVDFTFRARPVVAMVQVENLESRTICDVLAEVAFSGKKRPCLWSEEEGDEFKPGAGTNRASLLPGERRLLAVAVANKDESGAQHWSAVTPESTPLLYESPLKRVLINPVRTSEESILPGRDRLLILTGEGVRETFSLQFDLDEDGVHCLASVERLKP